MRHDPSIWGLERRAGRLVLDGHDLTQLADVHGTPLHVASARILREHCKRFTRAFSHYAGGTRIHFSYKTNAVAGLLRVIHGEGIGAEVVTGYELWLAQELGVPADAIVFNGPNKSTRDLERAVAVGVGLLVIDGLNEIERLERIAEEARRNVRIALRICPDVVPHRMNASSLAGSRRNQFGLDLASGEAERALARTLASPRLDLVGVMAHVGSGVQDLGSFERVVAILVDFFARARRAGATLSLIDVGGGLGTRASREMTTLEMLAYLALGRLPRQRTAPDDLVERYAARVSSAIESECRRRRLELPTLVLEPGRALVSDAQVLLLRVGAVRDRPGVGRFAVTDGGAMTVSMMFLSECHEILLANRDAADDGCTSIFGALPSPMDVVYRNLPSPRLEPGDLLAVADAGAYFTSTSTNFGGPRAAVVLLDGAEARLVRRRESFEDVARTDIALSDREASPPVEAVAPRPVQPGASTGSK